VSVNGVLAGEGISGRRGGKGEGTWGEQNRRLHIYEDCIMKPTKYCLKRGRLKYNRGTELLQNTLYVSTETSP
jgi:hypothetical protein